MGRSPFLDVVVHDLAASPSITAACAGYENGAWRAGQLAHRLITSIPEFALSYSERQTFADDTAIELIELAVRKVYLTDKYQRRGEFGELLLHLVLREVFNSEPAISKIFFKDAANDTVKGFDAVHLVAPPGEPIELWLGEVKFYSDLTKAIYDVVAELRQHTESDYLRQEFAAVAGKLDATWPHTPAVRALLDGRRSLDSIFETLTIPVLLTYESTTVAARVAELGGLPPGVRPSMSVEKYRTAFEAEARAALAAFSAKDLPDKVRVRLILVPLHTKANLLSELHGRLQAWQRLTAG